LIVNKLLSLSLSLSLSLVPPTAFQRQRRLQAEYRGQRSGHTKIQTSQAFAFEKKNHVYLVPKTFVLRMRTFSGPFFRWKVAAGPYLQKASHRLGAQQQTDKTPKEMLA
jgi:hypothetical protein